MAVSHSTFILARRTSFPQREAAVLGSLHDYSVANDAGENMPNFDAIALQTVRKAQGAQEETQHPDLSDER